ncbi:MAG: metal ABC transporter solute-binding protein, Zn/Mn family [Candidatus Dormibacteria bacterium]
MSFVRGTTTLLLALLFTGCGLQASHANHAGTRLEVVAAENFWGSIVAQLGGDRVHVLSVVSNPATDPHAYEPKPGDARAVARASYVVANGAGYDAWMGKLTAANPVPGRRELVVATAVGRRDGDNPHFWYSPTYVDQVVSRVTSDLQVVDPAGAAYYAGRGAEFRTTGLKEYHDLVAAIASKYHDVPIGATESIFGYVASDLGLNLLTPVGYQRAISEGSDPSAADKVVVDQQVSQRAIKVLVYNAQNTTPGVESVVTHARGAGIPVTAVTETLDPPGATFQAWQSAQLRAVLQALGG